MFVSSATESNRQAIISDMVMLSSRAHKCYRTPALLGGGNLSFSGFSLSALDTANANSSYNLLETVPTGTAFVAGSTTPVSPGSDTFYIIACGKEIGDNQSTPVKTYLQLTPTDAVVSILN